MTLSKKLDQFYTNPTLAENFTAKLLPVLKELGYADPTFLEPAAGTGAFLVPLDKRGLQWVAYDIDPHFPGVQKKDFLAERIKNLADPNLVIIGNPPFGKKSKLALDFMERGFEYSDTIAFILPIQFRKFLTQKQVVSSAQLVVDVDCPKDAFIFNGKSYHVRCCFQVWTKKETVLPDLRMRTKPPVNHPDFDAWIYNATKQAEKVFDNDWEFIVQRQGWSDFTLRSRDSFHEAPSLKTQWLLLKPKSVEARSNLLKIDFEGLADKNTSVRGFGKADLVEEYVRLFGVPEVREGLFET